MSISGIVITIGSLAGPQAGTAVISSTAPALGSVTSSVGSAGSDGVAVGSAGEDAPFELSAGSVAVGSPVGSAAAMSGAVPLLVIRIVVQPGCSGSTTARYDRRTLPVLDAWVVDPPAGVDAEGFTFGMTVSGFQPGLSRLRVAGSIGVRAPIVSVIGCTATDEPSPAGEPLPAADVPAARDGSDAVADGSGEVDGLGVGVGVAEPVGPVAPPGPAAPAGPDAPAAPAGPARLIPSAASRKTPGGEPPRRPGAPPTSSRTTRIAGSVAGSGSGSRAVHVSSGASARSNPAVPRRLGVPAAATSHAVSAVGTGGAGAPARPGTELVAGISRRPSFVTVTARLSWSCSRSYATASDPNTRTAVSGISGTAYSVSCVASESRSWTSSR